MSIVFGIALILSNAIWAALFWRRESTMLELGKLLASRTLSEYSWLKAAEAKKGEGPEKPAKENYENIWEDPEDGQHL